MKPLNNVVIPPLRFSARPSASAPASPRDPDAASSFPATGAQSSRTGRRHPIDSSPALSVALDAPEGSGDPDQYAEYFRNIGSGYKKNIDHMMVEPMICQPTPKGLALLVEDFVQRTGHDLRVEDQQACNDPHDSMIERFKSFSKTLSPDVFHQAGPVGVILTLGQQHACPVFLVRRDDVNHVLIFDSTSGGMTKAYRRTGEFFPDCKVMLNRGTRQMDSQSCITDAFEILCRALTVDDLVGKVISRVVDDNAGPSRAPRRFALPAPEVRNFQLFRMPEELCFTAQKTEFVTLASEANLQLKIKDRKGNDVTLENFLRSKKTVVIDNQRSKNLGINSYLHDVSIEHQDRIKQLVDRKAQQGEAGSLLV